MQKLKNWARNWLKEEFEKARKDGYYEGQQWYDTNLNKLRAENIQLTSKVAQFEAKQRNPEDTWYVDPELVFAVTKTGLIQLNGKQVTAMELKNMKSEVRAMKEFTVYKVIDMTLRQKAIEKAVLTSTDLYSLKGNEQVLAGKMMIYNLDIIKTILNAIEKSKA